MNITIGKTDNELNLVYDITEAPHLFIYGQKGSGKTKLVDNIILELLDKERDNDSCFIMIDTRKTGMEKYNGIVNLLVPVITSTKRCSGLFAWFRYELERRYETLAKTAVTNYEEYVEKMGVENYPRIFLFIEEIDVVAKNTDPETPNTIVKLIQLGKTVGLHLILCTEYVESNENVEIIKCNIPCRAVFKTNTEEDSRHLIHQTGPEKLRSDNNFCFLPTHTTQTIVLRTHEIDEQSTKRLLEKHRGEAQDDALKLFIEQSENMVDELYDHAVKAVRKAGRVSIGILQKTLSIGYARAARIMDEMEYNHIISARDENGEREVYRDPNKKFTIFYIDDEDDIRRLYSTFLREKGYEVVDIGSPEDLDRTLEENEVDMMILDIMLPIKDGLQILKEIRQNPKYKKTPIIMLSNLNMMDVYKEAFVNGADWYIVNSEVTPDKALEEIEKFVPEQYRSKK